MYIFRDIHPTLHASLMALAAPVFDKVEPDHWVGSHPDGDTGDEYCPTCCQKAVDNINAGKTADGTESLSNDQLEAIQEEPVFVDGGWTSEYDKIPRCTTCDVFLTGSLTDTAIDGELSHYEQHGSGPESGKIEISSPEKAYELLELAEAGLSDNQIGRLEAFIPSVEVATQTVKGE
ncbi:MAG: hypothetical protein CL840_15355 [Crocinitomicaceae bacterium]|nr:hypothetical protein [Crocinitomicaceae bacterium]|tara:strand:+ start:96520 stop:97050 length:531 start_codon:yes stop_codon:yes gene_type:complete